MNKVLLIGFLGSDPEIRYTKQGTAFGSFSVATSERSTKDGEKKEFTTWHRIKVWDKQAEICAKYLEKGSHVAIEGSIMTEEYRNKEGVNVKAMIIRAGHIEFLSPSKGKGKGGQTSTQQSSDEQGPVGLDDIPF